MIQDLLSIAPLIYNSSQYNMFRDDCDDNFSKYYILLFYIKFGMFFDLQRKLKEHFYTKKNMLHLISLFEILFTILFTAHIFACFWIYIAIYEKKQFG